MPYIDQKSRDRVTREGAAPGSAGELNFLITRLVLARLGEHPRYEDFNAAIGALECAKLELYRRMVAPYEDKKIVENGDVYPGGLASHHPWPPDPAAEVPAEGQDSQPDPYAVGTH
jgi:hypothetical protein